MVFTQIYQGRLIIFSEEKDTYLPDRYTKYMANALSVAKGDVVIDVATGSGALAIVASKLGGRKIIGSDIYPSYKQAFVKNCNLNGVKGVTFTVSNLLSEITIESDVIIANLPQTPFFKKIDSSIYGGEDGTRYLCQLIPQAAKLLKKGGKLFLNGASLTNRRKVLRTFNENGFSVSIKAKHRRYFSRESADRWQPGLWNHFQHLRQAGTAIYYRDGAKLYYHFYVYEGIKK
jgi:ribosomal protein L11 methylase PrmA